MAVTIDGTTGISAVQAGAVESSDLPAGSVIQVVQTVKTSGYIVSLSALALDTQNIPGLDTTITPTSTSSKILVIVEAESGRAASSSDAAIRLYKNGSILTDAVGADNAGNPGQGVTSGGGVTGTGYGFHYLDSPNTTSEVTYGIRFKSVRTDATRPGSVGFVDNGSSSVSENVNKLSTITLMEIAG